MNGMSFKSHQISDIFGIAHKHIGIKIKKLDFGTKSEYENTRGRAYDSYDLSLTEAIVLSLSMENYRGIFFKKIFTELLSNEVPLDEAFVMALEKTKNKECEKIEAYTYIIQDYTTKLYKIGKTVRDLDKRLMDLQRSTPNLLEISCYIAKDIELELHNIFADKRQISEWFNINEEEYI